MSSTLNVRSGFRMKFSDWLKQFPGVRLAKEQTEDNEKILKFYNEKPMQGKGLSITSIRGPDFFELLREQGSTYFVMIGENEKGDIYGMVSVTLRKGFINGIIKTVAYWGDFRLARHTGKQRFWQNFFSSFYNEFTEIDEFKAVSFFYNVIIDENRVARQSLIGRTASKSFLYSEIVPYQMVNLLRQKPWYSIQNLPNSYEAVRLPPTTPELINFLDEGQKEIPFGYPMKNETLQHRLKTWPGFKEELFWVLREKSSKNILAAFLIWSPEHTKYNRVDRLPKQLKWVARLLSIPQEGEKLKIGYLTHLSLHGLPNIKEKAWALQTLLNQARQDVYRKYHILGFCDYRPYSLLPYLNQWWLQTVPMTLFEVHSSEKLPTKFNPPIGPDGVGFEMAMV
jgi:hypothetical protein